MEAFMVKMIFFVLILIFASVFIGLNIDNTCTIWLIKEFTEVPVFLVVFIALGVGVLLMLPFCFARASYRGKKIKGEAEKQTQGKKTKSVEKTPVENSVKPGAASTSDEKKDNVVHLV